MDELTFIQKICDSIINVVKKMISDLKFNSGEYGIVTSIENKSNNIYEVEINEKKKRFI